MLKVLIKDLRNEYLTCILGKESSEQSRRSAEICLIAEKAG